MVYRSSWALGLPEHDGGASDAFGLKCARMRDASFLQRVSLVTLAINRELTIHAISYHLLPYLALSSHGNVVFGQSVHCIQGLGSVPPFPSHLT